MTVIELMLILSRLPRDATWSAYRGEDNGILISEPNREGYGWFIRDETRPTLKEQAPADGIVRMPRSGSKPIPQS
jgi:hypothetical protein